MTRTNLPTSSLAWKIHVSGYMEPDATAEQNACDWLQATIHIRTTDGFKQYPLPLLTVEILENIAEWLKLIRNGELVQELDTLDPDFRLLVVKRAGARFVKLICRSDPRRRHNVDLPAEQTLIDGQIDMIEQLIACFPCRCRKPHDLVPITFTGTPSS